MKKYLRDYTYLALVAGVIVAIDQISKAYIRAHLGFGEVWYPVEWLPFFRIVNWYNTGVAFGMMQGYGQIFKYLAVVIAGAIIYYFPRVPSNDRILRFALALQLAGALGNLIDRLVQGQVTDFISVGNFPVFNVADASITTGVGILILAILIQEQRDKKAAALAEQAAVQGGTLPEDGSQPAEAGPAAPETPDTELPAAGTPSENEPLS